MLLSTEAKVVLGGTNAKYYESLGYEIPRRKDKQYKMRYKRGTTITVKVEDLPEYSTAIVDLNCDCCKKIYTSRYSTYFHHNHNGLTYCSDCVHKILLSGDKSPLWNPNLTDEERENGRNYPEYLEFVRRTLARDNYTCQCCGKTSNDTILEVHHLNGYSWFIEGRTDETNSITLCKSCHANYHGQYGNKHVVKEDFYEWFGKIIELVKCGIEISPCKQPYCIETDKTYDSLPIMCKEIGIPMNTKIYDICNKVRGAKTYYGYHFLWHDDFIKMTKDEIDEYIKECDTNSMSRQIICLETNEVFNSLLEATLSYGVDKNSCSNVLHACKTFGATAYNLEDGTPLHWMFYEDYLNTSNETIEEWKRTYLYNQKIICLNTKEVYRNATQASKMLNIGLGLIVKNCKGQTNSAGKYEDGIPICWMYYNDYLKLVEQGIEPKLHKNITWRRIICITTGKIFNQCKEGQEYYGLKYRSQISACCKGKEKSAGKLPDGTKLQWMYYEDFLKLPQEQQNEILARNKDSSNDESF